MGLGRWPRQSSDRPMDKGEKRRKALKNALLEVFFAETVGGFHVDDAVEWILGCSQKIIPHILNGARLIAFSISDLLAFHFIQAITEAHAPWTPQGVMELAKTCIDVYERKGLQQAIELLKGRCLRDPTEISRGISLDEIRHRYAILVNSISRRAVEFREGRELVFDGAYITIPERLLSYFRDREWDLKLIKISLFIKALEMRLHSFVWLNDLGLDLLEKRGGFSYLYPFLVLMGLEGHIHERFPRIYHEFSELKGRCMSRFLEDGKGGGSLKLDPLLLKVVSFLKSSPHHYSTAVPLNDKDTILKMALSLSKAWRGAEHERAFRLLLPFLGPLTRREVDLQREDLERVLESRFLEAYWAIHKKGPKGMRRHKEGPFFRDGIHQGEQVLAIVPQGGDKIESQDKEEGAPPRSFIELSSSSNMAEKLLQELETKALEGLGPVPDDLVQSAIGRASRYFDPRFHVDQQAHPLEDDNESGEALSFYLYDEWDFRRQGYRKEWCKVREIELKGVKGDFFKRTLEAHKGSVTTLKRQFEALRQEYRIFRRRYHGDELDLDAVVEAEADRLASGRLTDRLYMHSKRDKRDISVLFLVDMSASTEGWVSTAIKESLIILTQVLNATGDRYAIYGFSGMRRTGCQVYKIKGFNDPYSTLVEERINGIGPRDYTRMGASIRHANQIISKEPSRTRLLIIISDGKPEDYDEYKGPYALEDTRHAVIEARLNGTNTFCITIDKEARDYIPFIFGPLNYILIQDPRSLKKRMPEIYRRLAI